jgi:hypothetical protein
MLLTEDWTISLLRAKPLINFAPNGMLIVPGRNILSPRMILLTLTDSLPYITATLTSITPVPLLDSFVKLAHSRMKHKPTALQLSLKTTPPESPNKWVQLLINQQQL